MWDNLILTVECCSPKLNSKKTGLRNMEPPESRKNDNFGKSSKFTGIPAGNFRDLRLPGIPEREFPVALASAQATLRYMGSQLPLKRGTSPIFDPCLLLPSGWMDQDATTEVGLGPGDNCVRWNPFPQKRKRAQQPPTFRPTSIVAPQFLAPVCCGQRAGWIKMSLRR